MPINSKSDAETAAILASVPLVSACDACWHGRSTMLRVTTTRPGVDMPVYVAYDPGAAMDALVNAPIFEGMITAESVDRLLASIEAVPHVEGVVVNIPDRGEIPSITFTAPAFGRPTVEVCNGIDTELQLRRLSRGLRQDTEARTMTRLGAMVLAVAAETRDDVDRIVDTIFIGGSVTYRGVHAEIGRDMGIVVSYDHQGVQMRSDGIEIADLPETIRAAIKGRQRRRLEDVAAIPGFDDLDIVAIGYNAVSARRWPGRSWVRLDVRDAAGAKFEMVEIEEARRIAQEMYSRRNPSC